MIQADSSGHPALDVRTQATGGADECRRSLALARKKALAGALLLAMAGLTVGGLFLPPSYATGLLEAAARAGLIGGLADWFAVTALFRHPLGLPIPHTAILPRHKDRLGRALGQFVARHVFTEQDISHALSRIDLGGIVARLLDTPEISRPVAKALAGMAPQWLDRVEDGRAARVIGGLLPRLLGGASMGSVIARVLRGLVATGRHQQLMTFAVHQLRDTLRTHEESIRTLVQDRVREQGGRLVGWAVGASVASRVMAAVSVELDKIDPDDSEMRAAFDAWVAHEIDRIETDPDRAAEIGRALTRVLRQPAFRAWLAERWARLHAMVKSDADQPDSRIATAVETMLHDMARLLASDDRTRATLQTGVERLARIALPTAQDRLAEFMANVVTGWDAATLLDRLESRVGPDLQWIRINGTVFGCLAGAALYVLLTAIGRHGY